MRRSILATSFLLSIASCAYAAIDPFIEVKGGDTVEHGIASRYGYNTGAPACGIPMVGKVAADVRP